MPGMPSTAGPGPTPPTGRGLVLRPFRALRFAPGRVELAAVTCPPYDVIERDGIAALESLEDHNVVRLILPRTAGAEDRYAHAARLLAQWQAEGVLGRDDEAALYVYEQRTDTWLQRGLIGALELRRPEERVILPHEDVMPGPVEDRLALMRATAANLEPILLVYEGGGPTADVVAAAADAPPLLEATTLDGVTHRIWALRDPAALAAVQADLAPRQAMIADGHHRYATYLRLQDEHVAAGDGPGPWDAGLALLVDATHHPLEVRAIHRVVANLPSDEAARRAAKAFRVQALAGPAEGLALLARPEGRHRFVLHGAAGTFCAEDPDPAQVHLALGQDRPALWRSLDAAVLHGLLIDALWDRDDATVGYHHDVQATLQAALDESGTAVLLRPPALSDVQALAARGERMPRKTTSFGPKPRTGLVLRTLGD